jgi:hypothetical protein
MRHVGDNGIAKKYSNKRSLSLPRSNIGLVEDRHSVIRQTQVGSLLLYCGN